MRWIISLSALSCLVGGLAMAQPNYEGLNLSGGERSSEPPSRSTSYDGRSCEALILGGGNVPPECLPKRANAATNEEASSPYVAPVRQERTGGLAGDSDAGGGSGSSSHADYDMIVTHASYGTACEVPIDLTRAVKDRCDGSQYCEYRVRPDGRQACGNDFSAEYQCYGPGMNAARRISRVPNEAFDELAVLNCRP